MRTARTKSEECRGLLAYEGIGGMRLHRDGVYRWRCESCGCSGHGDGKSQRHGDHVRRTARAQKDES